MTDPTRKDPRKEVATVKTAVRFVLCSAVMLLGESERHPAMAPLLLLLPSRGFAGVYVGDGELGPGEGV